MKKKISDIKSPGQGLDYALNPIHSPVESVSGVWKFRREAGHRTRINSLSEHLLQLVLKGCYAVRTNNREYVVSEGDVIYFYAEEDVEWLGNEVAVEFYSVGFRSIDFKPLPLNLRVFQSNNSIRRSFEKHCAASIKHTAGTGKSLSIHLALLEILTEIAKKHEYSGSYNDPADAWWNVERAIRQQHIFRSTLDEVAELARCSRASAVRLCRRATGVSPMKRLQAIRMEEARSLICFSSLNVTEIAYYLGYGRMHEFSREFKRYFGVSPSRMNVK